MTSTQFQDGLFKNYNMTMNDIVVNGYKYCGGNKGRHLNYFRLFFSNDKPLPTRVHKCVCGHDIVENCYIINETRDKIIVLGNCCIKRFLSKDKSGRTCEVCGKPHKNRSVNQCNDCRVSYCIECGEKCLKYNYKYCYLCY